MDSHEKRLLLEPRIITPESRKFREEYNNEPVPIISELENYEFFEDMKKFKINQTYKTDRDGRIYMPDSLIRQYLGLEEHSVLNIEQIKDEFMFWHSRRGLVTRMLLIPVQNYEFLKKYDKAKKFIEYFDMKEDKINIKRNQSGLYTIWGVPTNYTHPGRNINFFAVNSIYIRIERIIENSK